MSGAKIRAILVLLAALAFVLSPVLSQSFGGYEPSQFPVPQDDPPAQPAGWAFSIWSLIYLWLVVHAGYGLWRRAGDPAWDRTRVPLITSLANGALWIPVALVSPLWATLIIWIMLAAALVALLRTPREDFWLLRVPLALYAGWLTAASWVSVALIGAGWGVLMGAVGWAWVVLAAALLFAAAVLTRLGRAPEYALPIAWALLGIAAANYGGQTFYAAAALLGAAGVVVMALRVRRG
jgi:hypothetical protein